MKKFFIFIFALFIAFLLPFSAFAQNEDAIKLTKEEIQYLESKETIKMVVDPDWYPYEQIDENRKYVGIASDLIYLISERTGLKFETINTTDWEESLEKAKNGEVDVVSFLNKTEERSSWLIFTEPYFIDPNVIITREEHDYITDLSRYIHETLVLPEGTSIEERIRQDYPELKIVIVDSEEEAIKYVEEGEADFTLRSLTMAAYVIKNEGRFNLKIAGEIPEYKNQLRMGITNQDKILQSILNKGIESISEQDVQNAINNHVSIKVIKGFDYSLFFIIFSIFSVALISMLFWFYKIKKLNKRLEISEMNYKITAEELAYKNELLQISAYTDFLTGLRNRSYFHQSLIELIEKSNSNNTKFSVLLIDIDHFKRINDCYGHEAGDEVLKNISKQLQNTLGGETLVARWGGEEFIALLKDTDISQTTELAEKIRKAVETLVHINEENITISIGISEFIESETLESLIRKADNALYLAKKQGRNRICISKELLSSSDNGTIKWEKSWESGNEIIDRQHIDLISTCNILINSMIADDNSNVIILQLKEFVKQTKEHFKSEEDILFTNNYSDLEEHKIKHEELIFKAENLIIRAEEGIVLPIEVAHFILDEALVMHLLEEDFKFFNLFNKDI